VVADLLSSGYQSSNVVSGDNSSTSNVVSGGTSSNVVSSGTSSNVLSGGTSSVVSGGTSSNIESGGGSCDNTSNVVSGDNSSSNVVSGGSSSNVESGCGSSCNVLSGDGGHHNNKLGSLSHYCDYFYLIYTGAVIHLFPQDTVKKFLYHAIQMLCPNGTIFGKNVGARDQPFLVNRQGRNPHVGSSFGYLHTKESIKELLEELGLVKVESWATEYINSKDAVGDTEQSNHMVALSWKGVKPGK